jgi:hypothetical protein
VLIRKNKKTEVFGAIHRTLRCGSDSGRRGFLRIFGGLGAGSRNFEKFTNFLLAYSTHVE